MFDFQLLRREIELCAQKSQIGGSDEGPSLIVQSLEGFQMREGERHVAFCAKDLVGGLVNVAERSVGCCEIDSAKCPVKIRSCRAHGAPAVIDFGFQTPQKRSRFGVPGVFQQSPCAIRCMLGLRETMLLGFNKSNIDQDSTLQEGALEFGRYLERIAKVGDRLVITSDLVLCEAQIVGGRQQKYRVAGIDLRCLA